MRIEGWEQRLAQLVENARDVEFAWGSNDCVLWCARSIKATTGRDLTTGMDLSYRTREEAQAVLEGMGHASAPDLASAYLPEISPAHAQRGDLLLYPDDATLGICAGRKGYFLTEKGITAALTLACPKAWKVD